MSKRQTNCHVQRKEVLCKKKKRSFSRTLSSMYQLDPIVIVIPLIQGTMGETKLKQHFELMLEEASTRTWK